MSVGVEIVGWTSAVVILAAYALVTTGRLTGRSLLFQLMNLAGAGGFVFYGWTKDAVASVALNLIWAGITGVALWTIWRRKGSSTSAM